MGVLCRQTVDDEVQEYPIAPHSDDASDQDLLECKARGAAEKGWAVEWTSPSSFRATKVRWGGVVCVREVWIE